MKILVIGSKGFIGSHCVRLFSQMQNEVWAADTSADKDQERYFQLPQVHTPFDLLFQQHRFDVCINASGSANVAFSFENPDVDFELNVVNVHKMLVAIRRYNPTCKLINFSSAAVYGNPAKLPIVEHFPTKPLSPYGFHKLQSESLLAEYHKFFGLHTCSLRVFSAYGEGLKKQLFWDLHQKALQSETLSLFGTGEETRDFIHIDDLVSIVDIIIQKAPFEGDVFNVASGQEIKIEEAVKAFLEIYAPEKQYIFSGKQKIGDPNNWCADISKIKEIGFYPKVKLQDGLNRYVKWIRELN